MADSLDSGSSVHYARAGSSPASRTKSHRSFLRWVPSGKTSYLYARVVELADSLDSGSSVHYGRAGSSPASRTNKKRTSAWMSSFYWCAFDLHSRSPASGGKSEAGSRQAEPTVSNRGAVCKKQSKSYFPCKMQAPLLYYKSVSAGLSPRFWEI